MVPTACNDVFRMILWINRDCIRQNNCCENCGVSVYVVPVFSLYPSPGKYFSEYFFRHILRIVTSK
jgi:hypothetical protein